MHMCQAIIENLAGVAKVAKYIPIIDAENNGIRYIVIHIMNAENLYFHFAKVDLTVKH